MSARSSQNKRHRVGSYYHDVIPSVDGFDLIQASEVAIRNVGGAERATRRVDVSPVRAARSWDQITDWSPPDDDEYALNPSGEHHDAEVEADIVTEDPLPKKKRSVVSKRPHKVWKELHRQCYLEEIIRWAGRGDFWSATECPDCKIRSIQPPRPAEYRCQECFTPDLQHPFHRIEYCNCTRAIPQHLQLLRRGLYPASQITIKTCATFELLSLLHKLALTTKASTYDFYRCLEKMTSNTGMNTPPSRYRALFRMVLQWRHLQMLKWAGRGHDPSGAAGTADGELAIKCPSCPHPEINLPDNWESAPDDRKFLYMLIVCMDANFRLKNQLVSNYSQDPGLGIGMAYMLPRHRYEQYVASRATDKDISTCVGFQALAKANTKFSVGLRYTGLGMTVCGRSEMIMTVGNMHKGERYANMDYIFAWFLRLVAVRLVLVSYDIACQWFINLLRRMQSDWPQHIQPPANITLLPAIPKLHEPMHNQSNHQMYSLNFIPGVGQTDGECPERVWAPHNSLANATKTQGPGSRQDTLDDHFGFWNWQKYTSMGTTLLRRYRDAIAQRNIQTEGHKGFSESIKAVNSELLVRWEKMCVDWETEGFPKTKKNPYEMKDTSITEAQVKKMLADSEAAFLASGGSMPHKTTPSAFISMGLDLEETQRRLRRIAKNTGADPTVRQAGSLTEQRNVLITRICAWEQLLPIYLPGIIQYQTDHPVHAASTHAEDTHLWLPSSIPEPHRTNICAPGVANIERKLREAQLTDSLNAIRQILKVKARMIAFKNKNIRGQRGGTRSTSVIDRVHERARFAAAKYRAARVAHFDLVGPGEWEKNFRILEDKDIRSYQDVDQLRPCTGRRGVLEDHQVAAGEENPPEQGDMFLFNEDRTIRQGSGQTRRTLSWIWTVVTPVSLGADPASIITPGSELWNSLNEDRDDILRVEWARSRARMQRASEEVLLLKEEMRRVLVYLRWRANWWRQRENAISTTKRDMLEGISAYAHSQATLQDSLADHFASLWMSALNTATTLPSTIPIPGSTTTSSTSTSAPLNNPGSMVNDDDDDDDGDDDDDTFIDDETVVAEEDVAVLSEMKGDKEIIYVEEAEMDEIQELD
ncbi:hypothetical protein JR316_0010503 [Psilocybe cubensis]|uniref:Uncharacterized protein n=1 Tax=Psilocybe cubensis TaxID=181762 RepID=A0ACB8GN05_PSICU|nr:hypothetical protein JR316_0010503 [Psilocybe cubensis]KAH9476591.1 hypothetical protein JR316_0010503 [Psilocybe cubensis]